MAQPRDPKKGSKPSGVRGPGGPPPPPSTGRPAAQPGRPAKAAPPPNVEQGTGFQQALARRSRPALLWMSHLPRWVVVVTPALLLFLGLIQTGKWAWVGGLLLLLVAALLGWLTALSWPRITLGQKFARGLIVVALLGVAALKFMGRF